MTFFLTAPEKTKKQKKTNKQQPNQPTTTNKQDIEPAQTMT